MPGSENASSTKPARPVESASDPSLALAACAARPSGSLRWPIIVVSLLSVHLLLMLSVAAIATRDRSFAVLPNYYRNAIEWDRHQAQRRASQQLGWKIAIEPAEQIDPLGRRAISFTLTDAHDRPVQAESLDVSFFHHAHAGEASKATLSATAPGRFDATLPMRYAGYWLFDIQTSVQGQTFTASITQYVKTQNSAKRQDITG
jgi:nitrogen fixation protein FixH